jgi:hypothetical protein
VVRAAGGADPDRDAGTARRQGGQTLAAELPGYAEYAADVRYRLIPMVW